MNNKTRYAEEYRHDGGTYISCAALGKEFWDCKEDEMWRVNCSECEVAKRKEECL